MTYPMAVMTSQRVTSRKPTMEELGNNFDGKLQSEIQFSKTQQGNPRKDNIRYEVFTDNTNTSRVQPTRP